MTMHVNIAAYDFENVCHVFRTIVPTFLSFAFV